ncbi:GTP-binding protein [Nocardioides sp. TF02-7]|uniref:GTP-binding protein n=1 Tax=Nocardioides sp. TF02-7 TaxID=2917724 RepID=UPI001F07085C|nr:GTP-binding protein [Nocardioides sp. TF02-7]UMG93523.1 GTP-binding protein [Nocardioides sp. TF02-7]
MHVVATAGHVDHGKSTLVAALTGMEPDRLDEERRRGLSIELGYVWTDLPGAGQVAFVDVPGHERFVTTMLAGVGPVPVAMLVVAADDPWMPQAAEHLAALDALGVAHGLVAVTRSDLADPGPAAARAEAEVARTSLRGAPVVPVSGRTGAGLDELRSALADVLRALPGPAPAADVRLWVDRRFGVRGRGHRGDRHPARRHRAPRRHPPGRRRGRLRHRAGARPPVAGQRRGRGRGRRPGRAQRGR